MKSGVARVQALRSPTWPALVASLALLLSACGGGGDAPAVVATGDAAPEAGSPAELPTVTLPQTIPVTDPPPPAVVPVEPAASTPSTLPPPVLTAPPPPVLVTVPLYLTLRALEAAEAPAAPVVPPLDDVASAALGAADRQLAMAQLVVQGPLGAGFPGNGNVLSVPALTHAVGRTLGAAAFGETLAELAPLGDASPSPAVAAAQTGRVGSAWWVQRDLPLRTDFLRALDTSMTPSLWAAWSAAETDFAGGGATADAALGASLAAAGTSLYAFDKLRDIRAMVAHTFDLSVTWPAAQAFDGIFAHSDADMWHVPLLRLSAGVTRHVGGDFTAEVLSMGAWRLMTIRPAAPELESFATTRLDAALAESVQALLAPGVKPAAGTMVLPHGRVSASGPSTAWWRSAGVKLAFDEVNANLQALDGQGGTYVQATAPSARLDIAADGLRLQAGQALAFTYSVKNVHGPGIDLGSVTTWPNICDKWPTPDLRNFFLVLLDSKGRLVSMAAIQALAGTPVVPVCEFPITPPGG